MTSHQDMETDRRVEPSVESKLTSLFQPGETFIQNGREYKPYIYQPEENRMIFPEDFKEEDKAAYLDAESHLKKGAIEISVLNHRLTDFKDGLTYRGIEKIVDNLDSLDPDFVQSAKGYLLSLLNFGGTFHDGRSYVLAPPCSRHDFENQLGKIPSEALGGFDWEPFLDHLYNPTPFVCQGYYQFETEGDIERFESLFGSDYDQAKAELSALFDESFTRDLSDEEWEKYELLSQKIVGAHKSKIDQVTEGDDLLNALSTRVYFSINEQGEFSFRTVHYLDAFSSELTRLSRNLTDAANAYPDWAVKTKDVLEAHAAWCVTTERKNNWGESNPVWLNTVATEERLDINVVAEEKIIFPKGGFHMVVSQILPVPEPIAPAHPVLERETLSKGVVTMYLRSLIYAGHVECNGVLAGEKLPDPEGRPRYKSMSFVNIVSGGQILANAETIGKTMGLTVEDIRHNYADVPFIGVTYHELGHTRGKQESKMGPFAGAVEETNAQASAVYLTRIFSPEYADRVARFNSCWVPIRRAMSGVTEQHNISDVALVEEYLKAGAVAIEKNSANDGFHLEVKDLDALYQTAFNKAISMRLWEKGIPKRFHDIVDREYVFNPSNPNQDEEIIAKILERVDYRDANKLMEQTKREIAEYFSEARLHKIGKKLKPVINSIPKSVSMPFFPTNPTIKTLLGVP